MTRRSGVLGLVLVVAAAGFLAGCSGGNDVSPAKPANEVADAQIKAIEDNPNMPADQKEAALARLRTQKQAGEANSQANNGSK
ncbi:hypothetical protein BH11ARM2_BH11ARM2_08970 [soil metagenome]